VKLRGFDTTATISKFNILSNCNWFDAYICIFIVRIRGFQKFTRFYFNFWTFYPKNNHFAHSVSGRFLVCSKTHIMWLEFIQINSVHFFPQKNYLPWPTCQIGILLSVRVRVGFRVLNKKQFCWWYFLKLCRCSGIQRKLYYSKSRTINIHVLPSTYLCEY